MEVISCLGYQVKIGINFFEWELLKEFGSDWFILTDEKIYSHYKETLDNAKYPVYAFPEGEIHKNRATKEKIEDYLLSSGINRKTGIVAFGGGVVGDVAGFVAATILRGVKYVQVPTSLLSMVDSSVGAKTGVDSQHGKNLLGSIYRPVGVFIDLEFLKTSVLSAGMSEVIKMSMLMDKELYNLLLSNTFESISQELMLFIIKRSVELKKQVVEADEKEQNLRMILNFGHTMAHAVESELRGLVNHGICVGIGMVLELKIAKFLGLTEIDLNEVVCLLRQYHIDTELPRIHPELLLKRLKYDKKNIFEKTPIFVPQSVGQVPKGPIQVEKSVISFVLSTDCCVTGVPNFEQGVSIPGSKSITNRVLILASLCKNPTVLKNALQSQDTCFMVQALKDLGLCSVKNWVVTPKSFESGSKSIFVGNAGTVARFLTPLCALLPFTTVIKGSPRMNERPIGDLVEALNKYDTRVTYLSKEGSTPLKVEGKPYDYSTFVVKSKTSSQFISGLLMASPLTKKDVRIVLEDLDEDEEPVSNSYIEMTLKVMKVFGLEVQRLSNRELLVPAGEYVSPGEVNIEPDACSASYIAALSVLHKQPLRISGLGSESIQGEASFFKVLESIGCRISINPKEVVLSGESQLVGKEVNMSECTDSFMTAAVLMAVSDQTFTISGISNQRVKECNRIQAMKVELGKLGVEVQELPSGLRVFGGSIQEGVSIDTYDDHRIAMSFGVLSSYKPLVIKNKNTVDKTFPEFWKTLKDAGLCVKGCSQELRSVVVLGMRGVGKSSLSWAASIELGMEVVDLDKAISESLGRDLGEYIETEGWEAFRLAEWKALIENISKDCILVCGGGIVELEASRVLLKNHYPVVYVKSSLDNIKQNLQESDSKHRTPIDLESVYKSRKNRFEEVCDYLFYYEDRDLEKTSKAFSVFLKRAKGEKSPLPNDWSYFGCLTSDNLEPLDSQLSGIELRLDKLSKGYKLLTKLRQNYSELLTIATFRQESGFSENYWKVLRDLLKWAPDFIDVEFQPTENWILNWFELAKNLGGTRVILSYHGTEDLETKHYLMESLKPDIIKFISPYFRNKLYRKGTREITFSMGKRSQVTRVQNSYFNPVALEQAVAPGQLTLSELSSLQVTLNLRPQEFVIYLIGKNISLSPGPRFFNTLFQRLGLSIRYELLETENLEEVMPKIKDSACLGCSVTIPLKEQIPKTLHCLSPEIRKLKAVNTVSKFNQKLFGSNTDWFGIYLPLTKHKINTALVLGAGGTAKGAVYALQKLKVQNIYVWNRSEHRLKDFSNFKTSTDINEFSEVDCVVSTLPPESTSIPNLKRGVVVLEAAYHNKNSQLRQKCQEVSGDYISGLDMYLAQAYEQAKTFLGRNLLYREVKALFEAVISN